MLMRVWKYISTVILLVGIGQILAAQLQIQPDAPLFSTGKTANNLFATPKSTFEPQNSPFLIPEYVRQNPQGHAPLCRLETRIEKKLPVGLWFKIDESRGLPGRQMGSAHFRLRLKAF